MSRTATPTPSSKAPKTKPAEATSMPNTKPAPRARRRSRIVVDRPQTTPAAKSAASKPVAAQKSEDTKKASSTAKPIARSATSARTTRTGMSALDAAAQVLEGLKGKEAHEGIQAADLIGRMERARLWTSPGGKTPASTLYAAMMREITVKKANARFARVSPGHFAFKAGAKSRRGGDAQ